MDTDVLACPRGVFNPSVNLHPVSAQVLHGLFSSPGQDGSGILFYQWKHLDETQDVICCQHTHTRATSLGKME